MNDIGDAWYSLIIDESTTVEMKKVLCVMIRYYSQSKKEIVTTFYKLFEVGGGDATSFIKTFKAEIEQSGLKLEKLVGIGVDAANVMIGPHHSFSSLLKVNNKELVVVKCICHSLHLAAEHSCNVLSRCLDFIVKECHNWFSCSTKRQIEYNHLYKTLTDSIPLHISKLSGTRWLARYNGITKILEQWDALQLHFAIARDKERCYTAEQLYQMLKSNSNKLYFIFLKHMLEPLIETNKLFQMESADPLKLLQDVNCLLYYYIQIIVPPTALQNIAKQDIAKFPFRDYIVQTNLLNLGYSFQESSNIVDESTLKDIKQRCRDFIISLCDQLQQRVPDNITVLEKINLLSPQSATSQIRPDITDLISSFRNICQDIDVTLREWNLLHRNEWHQLDTCENFWTEVFHDKNAAGEQRYGHIAKLALALLSLPFSNATVERAFSIVSIIKNKLRNRMAVESACNIMRIRYSLRDGGCVIFKPTPNMLY